MNRLSWEHQASEPSGYARSSTTPKEVDPKTMTQKKTGTTRTKFYAGIGSRKTPLEILTVMRHAAMALAKNGWTLRSGGAQGADTAFEHGAIDASGCKEIYHATDCTIASMEIARAHHPAWHLCSEYARKLHGRNALIVLGRDLITPSSFVLCWQDPSLTRGGTKMGIAIAEDRDIRVHNLFDPEQRQKVESFITAQLHN